MKNYAKMFIEKNKTRWHDYKVLSQYQGANKKISFLHKNCGTEFEMTPHNFSAGHGCPVCAQKSKAETLRNVKGSKYKDYILSHPKEYKLIRYTDSRSPATVKHLACGREFSRIPVADVLKTGREICPYCAREAANKKLAYTVKEVNDRLVKTNSEYECLEYTTAQKKAKMRHKVCGNIFYGKAYYYLNGDGHCPVCTTHISKEEREIYEWVKQYCPEAKQSVRKLGRRELDILIPDKKVAIEFNGHYWHSLQKLTAPDKDGKPRMSPAEAKKYHYNKSVGCEKQGVRLIHIWDYEWRDPRKQAVLKNIILGAIAQLPERYYARECKVCRYDRGCERWPELNRFFEQNNIQGNRGGSVVFTLEKDGEILMAYKFGRPSGGKAKEKYQYEMVRGACKLGVQVIGGATRLWSHFVKEMKPKSVVYYVDYNYFDGRSVEKLGGRYLGSQIGVKNYWVKEAVVKNREPARHKEVKEAIEKGEVLELWNAGTKTYAFEF